MDIKQVAWFVFLFCFSWELAMPRLTSQQTTPSATTPSQNMESSSESDLAAPVSKVDYDIRINKFTDSLNIEYCQTCSYKTKVDEIRNALFLRYPHLIVTETPSYPSIPFAIIGQ